LNSQTNKLGKPISSWLIASRPKTLPAALAPVLTGSALAFHQNQFDAAIFIMICIAALFIQIGTNFSNDLHDFLKGTDTDDRLGPLRATQAGLLTPSQMKSGIVTAFFIALLAGCYLAYVGGWIIVVIGLTSFAAGLAYTAGPYPLGYHGWGDVFVFLYFGLIAVGGTFYLYTGTVNGEVILIGAAMGGLSTAILIVNNLRDAGTDIHTGKRTLAVRLGENFARGEYILCVTFPFVVSGLLYSRWDYPLGVFLTWFSLPLAINLIVSVFRDTGTDLNITLGKTARFLMIYSILLVLGLIL